MSLCDRPPGLFEWAFGLQNPKKNRVLVGQPILAGQDWLPHCSFARLARQSAQAFPALCESYDDRYNQLKTKRILDAC
jgi:hypothetical protein